MVRRTVAPAPSDCSRAKYVLVMERGTDIFAFVVKSFLRDGLIVLVVFVGKPAKTRTICFCSAFEARLLCCCLGGVWKQGGVAKWSILQLLILPGAQSSKARENEMLGDDLPFVKAE